MLAAQDTDQLHRTLLLQWTEARARTDAFFELLTNQSLYDRPIPERHRFAFYLGHLEAFDWNLLNGRLIQAESKTPELDHLFAFGIDPVDGGLPTDQPSDWPGRAGIEDYNRNVRCVLDRLVPRAFAGVEPGSPRQEQAIQLLNVAIEHRLMHLETLAYMLHQLPYGRKRREEQVPAPDAPLLQPEMIRVPSGDVHLGLKLDGSDRFGWDNEYGRHTVSVPSFSIDRYKVTNGEFLKFLAAGGYEDSRWWTEVDWRWRSQEQITHPVFWRRDGARWLYRGMFDEVPLPLQWPVYVSFAEASAYAKWAGKRLPTEAEWQRAAYGTHHGEQREYPWGGEGPQARHGYLDLSRWDPVPVNAFPASASGFGVEGLLGNGWEWTATPFGPFDGFTPFPFYLGYSANFFDGLHYVMKGGSMRTAQCMLRPTFRNWFQSHYQYVYAGFRCVAE